jgi:monoterpene epsilon-lactone hydrolase
LRRSGSGLRHDEVFIAELAARARANTLSLDYRLAPEHPCPAAIDDVVAAYLWLLEQGHAPRNIALCGASAGGGLMVAALMVLRDRGVALPACVALLSPHLDAKVGGDSLDSNTPFDIFGRVDGLRWLGWYAGPLDLHDPRLSPIQGDLRGLPKLLVHAGGAEKLRDDIMRFAEAAKAARVDVRLRVWPEMVHVFHGFPKSVAAVDDAMNELTAFLREETPSA